MKVVILICCLLATTVAAPQFFGSARIIKSGFNILDKTIEGASHAYRSFFETDNGINQEQIGGFIEGKENDGLVVKGIYSYIGDDGKNYTVQYTADKNGFHPQGEHLVPSAGVNKTKPLGIDSRCVASLCG